jgi:hypothetical protein
MRRSARVAQARGDLVGPVGLRGVLFDGRGVGFFGVGRWQMADEPDENLDSPMFERFKERARQVVVLAQEEARTLEHNYIGTEHLLLGLLREDEGLAARVLESLDITLERVRAQVVRVVGSGEEVPSGQIPFTPRVKEVFELALREALNLGHSYIGTEHILLGIVRENEGIAARVLVDFHADSEKVRNEVIRMLSGPGVPRRAEASVESGPEPAVDPGWLDGLPMLLKPLGEEIRAELGRAPGVGDLHLAVVCVPHTPHNHLYLTRAYDTATPSPSPSLSITEGLGGLSVTTAFAA